MRAGYDSGDKTPLEAVAYVTMQELATRIAHRNTGKECAKDGEVLAEDLMKRIATDENLHMVFYRNIGKAALDLAPNETMRAITNEVRNFSMPGDTIPNFYDHAAKIADAGIYNLDLHLNQVLVPTMRSWNIFKREDLTDDGALAREQLAKMMNKLKSIVTEQTEQSEEAKSQSEQ
jgi:acyl-[acyl-carrier-protein] desaturase